MTFSHGVRYTATTICDGNLQKTPVPWCINLQYSTFRCIGVIQDVVSYLIKGPLDSAQEIWLKLTEKPHRKVENLVAKFDKFTGSFISLRWQMPIKLMLWRIV